MLEDPAADTVVSLVDDLGRMVAAGTRKLSFFNVESSFKLLAFFVEGSSCAYDCSSFDAATENLVFTAVLWRCSLVRDWGLAVGVAQPCASLLAVVVVLRQPAPDERWF